MTKRARVQRADPGKRRAYTVNPHGRKNPTGCQANDSWQRCALPSDFAIAASGRNGGRTVGLAVIEVRHRRTDTFGLCGNDIFL